MSAIARVPCRACGTITTIEIITIDKLRSQNERLERQLRDAKQKIAALELMGKSGPTNMFDDLFRAYRG